jgi:hypothetical protein
VPKYISWYRSLVAPVPAQRAYEAVRPQLGQVHAVT